MSPRSTHRSPSPAAPQSASDSQGRHSWAWIFSHKNCASAAASSFSTHAHPSGQAAASPGLQRSVQARPGPMSVHSALEQSAGPTHGCPKSDCPASGSTPSVPVGTSGSTGTSVPATSTPGASPSTGGVSSMTTVSGVSLADPLPPEVVSGHARRPREAMQTSALKRTRRWANMYVLRAVVRASAEWNARDYPREVDQVNGKACQPELGAESASGPRQLGSPACLSGAL